MRAFLQNCPKDYDDDQEAKCSMKQLSAISLRDCVGEHAKQELYRPSSPTCVSSQFIGDKTRRSPEENKKRISPVTSKFPVQPTKESITKGARGLEDVS